MASKARSSKTCNLKIEKAALKKGHKTIAAIDEAGRGALAGPVVASAVSLTAYRFKEKIDDSKKLTAAQRQKAYKEIFKNARIGIGIVSQKEIDRVNIQNATMLAMKEAFENLDIDVDYLIVDGLKQPDVDCGNIDAIIGADGKSITCACASIVAKVTRDNIMGQLHRLLPQYNFAQHKGYGTRKHFRAIKKLNGSILHRKTFRPLWKD